MLVSFNDIPNQGKVYNDIKSKTVDKVQEYKENIKCKKANRPFEYNECISVNLKHLTHENAIEMTEYAVETKATNNIELAKKAISLVEDLELKEELVKEINNLVHSIEQKRLKENVETLLTNAIKSKDELEIAKINELIIKIDDEQLVNNYTEEVNKLIEVINEEKRIKAEEEAARKAEEERLRIAEIARQQALMSQASNKPVNGVASLEKVNGTISAFSPYCNGCGGYVASGKDVRNGNVYYNDSTYGTVRIVAGDSSYPFGTIVKLNLNGGTIYAVVLDRGSSIGKGRHRMWDLLFSTEREAYAFGLAYNVEAEILRLGF